MKLAEYLRTNGLDKNSSFINVVEHKLHSYVGSFVMQLMNDRTINAIKDDMNKLLDDLEKSELFRLGFESASVFVHHWLTGPFNEGF